MKEKLQKQAVLSLARGIKKAISGDQQLSVSECENLLRAIHCLVDEVLELLSERKRGR
jgi:hypothetical protein